MTMAMAMEPKGRETTDGGGVGWWVGPRDVMWLRWEAEDGDAGGRRRLGLTRRSPVVLVSAVLQHLHAARSPQGIQEHVVQRVFPVLRGGERGKRGLDGKCLQGKKNTVRDEKQQFAVEPLFHFCPVHCLSLDAEKLGALV